MKRPLAIIGLTGLTAQCLALMTRPTFSLLFAALTAVAAAVTCLIPRLRKQSLLVAALLSGAVVMGLTAGAELIWVEPVRACAGQSATVSGTLLKADATDTGYALTVHADAVTATDGGRTLCGNVRLILYTSQAPDAAPYAGLTATNVTLFAPKEGFGLSARSSCAAKGVYLLGSCSPYAISASPAVAKPWYAWTEALRDRLLFALRAQLPDRLSGLIGCVLLGDRSMLPDAVADAFRRCGMSHVLVVSGLHLSFLVSALLLALRALLRSYRAAAALCMPMVLLVLALTGFSGSAVRAGIMMLIYLLAILLARSADPLNSLGAAALVLLLVQPFCGGDVGVQLSFLATGGILMLSAPLQKLLLAPLPLRWAERRAVRWITGAFSVSAAATLFTTPLVVLTFGQLSLIGPLMNVAAAFPVEILLLSGAVAAVAGALGWAVLARPSALIAGLTARLLLDGTSAAASVAPVLYDQDGTLLLWVAGTLAAVGVLLLMNISRRKMLIAAGLCSVLFVLPSVLGVSANPQTTVGIVACGDGLAVSASDGTHSVLILQDGNGSTADRVSDAFSGRATVDVLLLPDKTNEPYAAEAAAVLLRADKVKSLQVASDLLPDALRLLAPQCPVRTGATAAVSAGDALRVERIETPGGDWLRLRVNEKRILIPLGDGDAAQLPPDCQTAEVLILAYVPENPMQLRADVVVLSCSASAEADFLLQVAPMHTTFYSTARSGSMRLTLPDSGEITAARD